MPDKSAREKTSDLEVLSFNSSRSAIILNNTDKRITAIDMLASVSEEYQIPGFTTTQTFLLATDIEPQHSAKHDFSPSALGDVESTVGPLADTWKEHYDKAKLAFGICLDSLGLSENDTSFSQIRDHYRTQGQTMQFAKGVGIVHYRIIGEPSTRSKLVQLVWILVHHSKCSPV